MSDSKVINLAPPPPPPYLPRPKKGRSMFPAPINDALWDMQGAVDEARASLELASRWYGDMTIDAVTKDDWERLLDAIRGAARTLRSVTCMADPRFLTEHAKTLPR